ncbi:ATPase family AAA domain-containing protein 3A homolog [Folsomia candida]|uniref:ATPase family AAA domain-containing protein 3A homolog n=1 Tax=Folsomia candida TaxID=158441 RepID=UPI000B8F7773|nr:ATPase family AAA domain-containing protein 3A homolog [Folsomia candida]
MSWLFGIKSTPPAPNPSDILGVDINSAAGGSGGDGKDPAKEAAQKGIESNYRFDSSALERAAAAAKDLEKSSHAKEALELAKLQEATKQKDYDARIAEFQAATEQSKMDSLRLAAEERRKILQEESKLNQQKALYEDELARRRYGDQLEQQKRAQEETLRRQEESVTKQEQIRQQSVMKELQMREAERKNRVKEEAEIKAKVERENRDIYLEQIRLRAQEGRVTTLESIKTIGSVVGTGLQSFVSDWDTMVKAAGAMSLLALGVYAAKNTTYLAARRMEAVLGKPSLVRETSRFSPLELFQHPIQIVKRLFRKQEEALSGVVLHPKLEERLRDIAIATKNTRTNKGSHRNVMFYGPPGTGKTLFAKRLAVHSGMDYALLSGGDVGPLGKDGVTAIHKVFDWAHASRKGLVLFLDEADAFLRKRSAEKMSEEMRSALNAFLYRTGEQSKKIMVVVASNTPEQLDFAVNDRIDEMVHFILPGKDERERLVRLYFDRFILEVADKRGSRMKLGEFDYSQVCSEVATVCEGMSGREIAKLASAWQATAFASEDGILTKGMMLDRARDAAVQHRQKTEWLADSERTKTFAV